MSDIFHLETLYSLFKTSEEFSAEALGYIHTQMRQTLIYPYNIHLKINSL